MGNLMSCAAVCCAACACEACKGALGSINRSTARLAYVVLFALSLLMTWLVRDHVEPLLRLLSTMDPLHFIAVPSAEWFKEQGVLRMSFATSSFFTTMALLLLNVRRQSDSRDAWHHGAWFLKIIVWLGLLVVAFILPDPIIILYAYVCRGGTAAFLFLQAVIILDAILAWNDNWAERDEQNWYMAMLVVSVLAYVATLVALILLAVWFVPSVNTCQTNFTLIFLSFLLIFFTTATPLHPKVGGSLLPASIVSLYCTYMLGAALSSEPRDYECNGLAPHLASLSSSRLVFSLTLTMFSVAYSALKAGSASALFSPPEEDSPGHPLLTTRDLKMLEDGNPAEDHRNDSDAAASSTDSAVPYTYSFFHLIFALAAMYSAMLLTGWGIGSATAPGRHGGSEGTDLVDVGWGSVAVKSAQQWGMALLYIWTLIAPLVFPDRDFS